MNKTFDEWVALFDKKVRKFERDERFALFYLPDKGFCELTPTEKIMFVGKICGDGRFWKEFADILARRLGLKVGGAIYGGRPGLRAWIRLWGYKIDKIDEENELKRYYCTKKTNGGWMVITEYLITGKKLRAYVTWEV